MNILLTHARIKKESNSDWITGFGMAGDESIGRAKDYAYSFEMAKEAGL